MKKLLLLLVLISSQVPASEPSGYTTADAAAVAAVSLILEDTTKHASEWGGFLLQCGQFYNFSEPQTSKEERNVRLVLWAVPNGCTVIGTYHTHIKLGVRFSEKHAESMHSDQDLATAHKAKILSYIGVIRTGKVKVYDPITRKYRNVN